MCVKIILIYYIYNIMLPVNNDILGFSFPILLLFISSSFLVAFDIISNSTLNEIGESGHSCHVP